MNDQSPLPSWINRHDLLQALGDLERTIYLLKQPEFDLSLEERKRFANQLQKSHSMLLELITRTFPSPSHNSPKPSTP